MARHELREAGADLDFMERLPLVVTSIEHRRRLRGASFTTWSGHLPPGFTYRVTDSAYALTPEACFLLAVHRYGLIEAVLIGMELCGSYAMPSDAELERARAESVSLPTQGEAPGNEARRRPSAHKRASLTSCSELLRFIGQFDCKNLSRKCSRALSYLIDGSASPAETALALLLSLPFKLGGYALPKPTLNGESRVSKQARGVTSVDELHCDLYWPESNVVIEYNSYKHHSGRSAFYRDANRATTLALNDETLFILNDRTIKNLNALEAVARGVSKKIGSKFRPTLREDDLRERRYALRDVLLPYMGIDRDWRPNL